MSSGASSGKYDLGCMVITAVKKKHTSCRVAAIRYAKKFLMRLNTFRLIMVASTIVERPGRVRTMSAAARAASVAPCTATPTSALDGFTTMFQAEECWYMREERKKKGLPEDTLLDSSQKNIVVRGLS